MFTTPKYARAFISLLIVVFSMAAIQLPAHAALITTQELASQQAIDAERAQLSERLLRSDVKQELLRLGVAPETVEQRINSLSHGELAAMNGKLDQLPAGGDGLGTVALVLLILILLEITGVIDIFPRI